MIGYFFGGSYTAFHGKAEFIVFPYVDGKYATLMPRLEIGLRTDDGGVRVSLNDSYDLPNLLRELADIIDAEWMAHIEDCHEQAINEDAIRSQVQIIKECRAIA